jgi:hypothetical protein
MREEFFDIGYSLTIRRSGGSAVRQIFQPGSLRAIKDECGVQSSRFANGLTGLVNKGQRRWRLRWPPAWSGA